ncbi:carbohydrate ABC transporter permease [Microbacterium sp. NC79]|uniref:carbohydrate ABC transporter permease n=1 Tax=Microbacterium sp. NC79 TaxID=2851009 RepID=UPI001C2CBE11|nr:sugar ABC transporter permease [Microbacterium sp. NC79]MBV0895960.1 sugar ABC transporter permease [Microbacterium sp. NC79]
MSLRNTAAPQGRRSRRMTGSASLTPLFLFAPAAIVLLAAVGYPLVRLVISSFQDFGMKSLFLGETPWVGFDNYVNIFTSDDFWPVILRTVAFTAACLIITVGLGMLMSELMMRLNKPMRIALNVVLILAWAIPTVTATLIWQWLFQPPYGVVNWLITKLGIFGDFTDHNWLTTPTDAWIMVTLLVVWQGAPFIAFTLYAGQSQIPREYYEAAMLDGASGLKIYMTVTFPFLKAIIYLVSILTIIWRFNIFNQIWILTGGGPEGGTTTLGIWSFREAFAGNNYGQGAAIAVVTAGILMFVTAFYVRRLVRSGEQL